MEVDKSIVPIFIETEVPKRISQIGTAVFVDFQNMPFLFTAAHVTDDMENGTLLVPTVEGLSEIDGYTAYVDLPPEIPRSSDSVDMAYIRLTSEFASKLCYNFFPLPQKKMNIASSALELGVVSVVGYPASKSKRKNGGFQSEMFYYRGVAADSDIYSSLDLCPTTSTVIHFSKKRAVKHETQEKYTPPSPNGVSGGALFAWPKGHELSQDWTIPQLVGIFHTFKQREGLMIGSNLINFAAATTLGQMKGFGGVV
ncbi:hypothetical protein NDN17_20840 [Shewanella algae]|uniref:hypothetical protein n=1 Tax=Shewanella algae TaxID=38313 RepID=UPI001AACA2AC|nr:hypothetical protein [Shewanella algae]MBO2566288.1 hypothetical protein [Shewanella algae]MCM2530938.1 hypothetical protein [Shewanella algae]HDS1201089.1 hypothetical protein [Shewanella algae]